MLESYPHSGIATRARQRIRVLLVEREMTILDLAGKVGWSRSAASRRLGRTLKPQALTIAEIEAVAEIFGVPVSAILSAETTEAAA